MGNLSNVAGVWLVFVTSARSSRVLATNRSKIIYRRDGYPCKESNALPRRHKLEACGFESWCRQKIFSHEITVMQACLGMCRICKCELY